jgi:hypothetical protein
MRNFWIITILLISLIVLLAACIYEWPLITGIYHPRPFKLVKAIAKTETGKKHVMIYANRLDWMVRNKLGRYKDIDQDNPEKAHFLWAGFVFVVLVAIFVAVISLILFILCATQNKAPPTPKTALFVILLLVILNGTVTRLIFASVLYGNNDTKNMERVSKLAVDGKNVYANYKNYNYSPVWFHFLGAFQKLDQRFDGLTFSCITRSFLTFIDLLTLLFLLLIASREKISLVKTSIFFYLNPVSYLITGYHGQFENFAILMVVVGLFAYLRFRQKPILGNILLWSFATFGMIIKHNIFFELIICLNRAIKRHWLKFLLFVVSACVFLSLFIPYWDEGKNGIIKNVFKYSGGYTRNYGLPTIVTIPQLKWAFVVGMFIFPLFLKSKDIIRQCLMGMLFFMTFTTGISIQYFILPIALGALRPSKGFLAYSLAATLYTIGNGNNVAIPILEQVVKWNIVWVASVFWFISEFQRDRYPELIVNTGQKKLQ